MPHDADKILANRMGDCKDHTTLLKALLAAKGIASIPVLINAGLAYTLPPAPAADIFNHLILYIPALNLYADSTSHYTSFRHVAAGRLDKPVVHVEDFCGNPAHSRHRSQDQRLRGQHGDGNPSRRDGGG